MLGATPSRNLAIPKTSTSRCRVPVFALPISPVNRIRMPPSVGRTAPVQSVSSVAPIQLCFDSAFEPCAQIATPIREAMRRWRLSTEPFGIVAVSCAWTLQVNTNANAHSSVFHQNHPSMTRRADKEMSGCPNGVTT